MFSWFNTINSTDTIYGILFAKPDWYGAKWALHIALGKTSLIIGPGAVEF